MFKRVIAPLVAVSISTTAWSHEGTLGHVHGADILFLLMMFTLIAITAFRVLYRSVRKD